MQVHIQAGQGILAGGILQDTLVGQGDILVGIQHPDHRVEGKHLHAPGENDAKLYNGFS